MSHQLTLAEYLNDRSIVKDSIQDIIIIFAECSVQIASHLAVAAIAGNSGSAATTSNNPSGEVQKKMDVIANELIKTTLLNCSSVAAIASEEEEDIIRSPASASAALFVAFDPLDGSSNIDCASPTGTIFGIYEVPPGQAYLCQAEGNMVGAGYILYSSSTEFVLRIGSSTSGFTLQPSTGSFILTRRDIRIPATGSFYSLNDGRSADWPLGLFTYIEDIKNGRGRQRVRYSSRYVCSLVADVHRTLLYGGWAGNPRNHLRLLFEAAPLAYLLEGAGGKGTDGLVNLSSISPSDLHMRLPVFLGSPEDINELMSYGDVQQKP